MRDFLIVFLTVCLLFSCKENEIKEVDVSNIETVVKIDRFEVDFYNSNQQTLFKTKLKYPMLFPKEHDSVWIQKINDKDERELFNQSQKQFKNIKGLELELENLFKHVKYYNAKFKTPQVITMLTNIDYDNKVIVADSLVLISLDCYLGEKHEFYNDFPAYIKLNNTKKHIVVDVANEIVNKQVPESKHRKFLDKMIAEGKKMYLLDRYLPTVPDVEKFGCSDEKYQWAVASEEEVWKYFISKDMLYSTELSLNQRFLDIAPFSKFYSGEDNLSPGRIGVYIGWQIVRSYMRNNDVSLTELMKTKEELIFKNSKYKPKR